MHSAILKIRTYGDPVLRKKAVAVKDVGPVERMLINSMIATMHHFKGIGLAAPQVGISHRIIVADVGEGPVALVNPKILKKSGLASLEEGCLSIPGITIKIKRPDKVFVEYTDESNKKVQKVYEELMARVILHETDHLNGKLIIDYATFTQRRKLKKVLEEITAVENPKHEALKPK